MTMFKDPSVSIAKIQHGIAFYLKVLYDPNTHIEAEFPVQVKVPTAYIYTNLSPWLNAQTTNQDSNDRPESWDQSLC